LKILIVIAARNDARSLNSFLPMLSQAAADLPDDCDIMVIDDGSEDGTATVAAKHGCLVQNNGQNMGIGSSLRRGYCVAEEGGYDVVVTMDADGQHDERFLKPMREQLAQGADIVVASRYHPDSERFDVPLDRDLLNVSMVAQMRFVTGWEITDPLSGFWMMNRQCFQFALKHGRQTRYGIHLENLIKFWYLSEPRPKLVEIAHPAIYGSHDDRELQTRVYDSNNQEDRLARFGTHPLHILQALEDVKRILPAGTVEREMDERRYR
jgi:glycosyltransferase involved in cell wall biosynthesis